MKLSKYLVLLAAVVFGVGVFIFRLAPETRGQTAPASGGVPDANLIGRFDGAVQRRFLEQPRFGMARIAPTTPQPLRSGHVPSFEALNEEENAVLSQLSKQGWKTAIYLFGKRATPREGKKDPMSKFDIRYRLNEPVPVSVGLWKDNDLPGPKKIIREVKDAFTQFQSESETPAELSFVKGEWSFVARPVRAVNESCVSCHADYVVTAKLDDGKYRFRKRRIGDVNGVIVYAFARGDSPSVPTSSSGTPRR